MFYFGKIKFSEVHKFFRSEKFVSLSQRYIYWPLFLSKIDEKVDKPLVEKWFHSAFFAKKKEDVAGRSWMLHFWKFFLYTNCVFNRKWPKWLHFTNFGQKNGRYTFVKTNVSLLKIKIFRSNTLILPKCIICFPKVNRPIFFVRSSGHTFGRKMVTFGLFFAKKRTRAYIIQNFIEFFGQ